MPRSPTGDDTATATAMSGAASIAQEMVIIKVEGVGARAEVRSTVLYSIYCGHLSGIVRLIRKISHSRYSMKIKIIECYKLRPRGVQVRRSMAL